MNESPLVSICIPTYNGEIYIKECLNSAINQTYSNIEIIISDDNSSDSTTAISKNLLIKKNIDFKIIKNSPSCTVADNWNNTIKNSSGDYIKMLFQDDYLYPYCIEKMVALAENHKELGMIFSLRDPIYEKNTINDPEIKKSIDFILKQKQYLGNIPTIQEGLDLFKNKYLISGGNIIGEPSNVLIRKNIFYKIGYFNTKIIQLIDLEMWYRIIIKYKIGFINEPLNGFRIHYDQLSFKNKSHRNQLLLEEIKIYSQLYEKLIILNFNKYYLSLLNQRIKKIIVSQKYYWIVIKPFWKLFYSIKKKILRLLYT